MVKPFLPQFLRTEQAEFVLELIAAAALGGAVLHWWLT